MVKPWIQVIILYPNGKRMIYDRTQIPSWAEHLKECARREYPEAVQIIVKEVEGKK